MKSNIIYTSTDTPPMHLTTRLPSNLEDSPTSHETVTHHHEIQHSFSFPVLLELPPCASNACKVAYLTFSSSVSNLFSRAGKGRRGGGRKKVHQFLIQLPNHAKLLRPYPFLALFFNAIAACSLSLAALLDVDMSLTLLVVLPLIIPITSVTGGLSLLPVDFDEA